MDRDTTDARWLQKLVAACNQSLDRIPTDDPASAALRADMVTFRDDVLTRIERLGTEDVT